MKYTIFFLLLANLIVFKNFAGDTDYLFMPWREQYIKSPKLTSKMSQCHLCAKNKLSDDESFILMRGNHHFVVLNLFPYSKGHLLIIPYAHVPDLSQLSVAARAELIELINQCNIILKEVLHYDALNMGINFGTLAGASIPDHMHVHVVPRYENEINSFMQVMAHTRDVPWDLRKYMLN